jgi:hypothetical protein
VEAVLELVDCAMQLLDLCATLFYRGYRMSQFATCFIVCLLQMVELGVVGVQLTSESSQNVRITLQDRYLLYAIDILSLYRALLRRAAKDGDRKEYS